MQSPVPGRRGIRGVVTTVLLERLVATPGLEQLLEKADLIAGTSIRGLLDLGIAHGLSLAESRDLYVTKGRKVFDDSWLDDLTDLGKLGGADDGTVPLRQELKVRLLSLGTGTNLQHIAGATHDSGYVGWARPLINLMLDGTAGIADYQCHQLLGEGYHRLAPTFAKGVNVPLDDVARIPHLIEFATGVPLESTIGWLKQSW